MCCLYHINNGLYESVGRSDPFAHCSGPLFIARISTVKYELIHVWHNKMHSRVIYGQFKMLRMTKEEEEKTNKQ